MARIAINGFGRIGRNILRAIYERNLQNELQVVAINDLGSPEVYAHLLKYDTTHGTFNFNVEVNDNIITVNGDEIKILSEHNPEQLPWKELQVDLVLECTGLFKSREKASLHLHAGAQSVLISAPGSEVDITVVYGVNHRDLKPEHNIVSNASCTTNCLAPLVYVLHNSVGIVSGLVNTVHSYTNDQRLIDSYHTDLHRARAAGNSLIPTKTGAAAAIGSVIPSLAGKLDGLAVRVPTLNVSLLDLTFKATRNTSAEEINTLITDSTKDQLTGIIEVNEMPLVSSDFNHNPASCIFDTNHTRVIDDQVKVFAWYDNEWGFSNRMLDTSLALLELKNKV